MQQQQPYSQVPQQRGPPTSFQNYNNIYGTEKVIYGTARVSDRDQCIRIICHFIPLFIASLALLIATGIYLFDVEQNNRCWGPRRGYDLQQAEHYVDVGRRFFIILTLFFAYYAVQCIRSLFVLLSLIPHVHVISSVHSFLFLNEFLGLGALGLAHIYRFQYAGRYCACRIDNFCESSSDLNDTQKSQLLIRRGEYILGLIIVSWVYFAFNWCMHLISIRRKEQAPANNAALPPA
jgi:hypothetical protein